LASDFGNASVKRARNITMNYGDAALARIQSQNRAFCTRKVIRDATIDDGHTAMSGLSASTYSWGGEGSRFGRGGEASTAGA
jgi:hypothetical protein